MSQSQSAPPAARWVGKPAILSMGLPSEGTQRLLHDLGHSRLEGVPCRGLIPGLNPLH